MYTLSVTDRIRVYHPDYPVSWADRIMDLFGGLEPDARDEDVSYALLDRTTVVGLRAVLDGMLHVSLLGAEMVRADTVWELPPAPSARKELCREMVRRLRFEQCQPSGLRTLIGIRWVQFEDAPHGARMLIRLAGIPNMGLKSVLAGNIGVSVPDWEEVAVG